MIINESGLRPIGENVLILPDEIKEKTQGGIFLPDETREKWFSSQHTGRLLAYGNGAFLNTVIPQAKNLKVYFNSYAGTEEKGTDGNTYRLCPDIYINAYQEVDKEEVIPIWDNVLLKLEKVEDVTKSGLITMTQKEQDMAQVAQTTGEVVKYAEGIKELEKGDNVLFTQYSGSKLIHNGIEYRIVEQQYIGAKLL